MIILDTNVVSEPLRPEPSPPVLAWLDRQDPATLYLATISLAELHAGIATLPSGRRRARLQHAVTEQISVLFADRVLAFDAAAADAFGRVFAGARRAGNPIDFADCAIAAIAAAHSFAVATRNARDFRGTGVALLNPWA